MEGEVRAAFQAWDIVARFGRDLIMLVIGVVLGLWVQVRYKKPRLVMRGNGGSSNKEFTLFRTSIFNQTSILGARFEGETAREVRASLTVKGEPGAIPLLWETPGERHAFQATISIAPGRNASLLLFQLRRGELEFMVIDEHGAAIRRFGLGEHSFTLTLTDHLHRQTRIPCAATFRRTDLRHDPQLSFAHTRRSRLSSLNKAFWHFREAIRIRQRY